VNVDGANHGAAISEAVMDEETRAWPVPLYCQDEFNEIKCSHRVQPLLVYHEEKFVEPDQTSNILAGSLAEIHFTIKNYTISKASTSAFDSFAGNVEEIHVLKVAAPKGNKRKNPRDGPVRTKVARTGTSASIVGGMTAHKLIGEAMPAVMEADIQSIDQDDDPKGKGAEGGKPKARTSARMSTGGCKPSAVIARE
jgi:hypothetical protein